MSRNSTHTIVRIPSPGTNFILRDSKTNAYIKASAVAHRDVVKLGKMRVKHIRNISGDSPNFSCKIGSHNTKMKIIKILVGEDQKKPMDESQRFEYIPLSIRQAKRRKMFFLDPGLVRNKGMLQEIMDGTIGKSSPSRDVQPKMKIKSKHMGRPVGSRNKSTIEKERLEQEKKQIEAASSVSEITMKTGNEVPAPPAVASHPPLTLSEGSISNKPQEVSEITLTLKKGSTVAELQSDFEAAVAKLAAIEKEPMPIT